MEKQFKKQILVAGLLSIVFYSCVNLRAVNDVSLTSLHTLARFEELNYSFTKHCTDRCVFELIRKFEIKRTTDCNCNDYKKADTVTVLIYNSIRGYFDGLAHLSEGKLTNYHLDPLTASLTEGSFGNLKIDKKQVDAFSAISGILLNASTGIYRKNKIKNYVEQANTPLQILLNKFQFILQSNLEDELNFKKEKLYAFYSELLMNTSLNEFEKGKASREYYEQISDIDIKQQQIKVFAKSLMDIAAAHQKIYDNRNKISGKELRNSLISIESNLEDIISQFNQLKK